MTNERLVFEPGNQWKKDAAAGHYFGVPVWWRRFVYRVLSAREYTVYSYLASVCDPNGIAYPTVEQICLDLGIKSSAIVSRAVDRLVKAGFMLRGQRTIKGRELSRRPVYQRPMAAYTLLVLLESREIDGRLFPAQDGRKRDFTDTAVENGLRKILGDEMYRAYEVSPDGMVKTRMLAALLRRKVQEATSNAAGRANGAFAKPPTEVLASATGELDVPF